MSHIQWQSGSAHAARGRRPVLTEKLGVTACSKCAGATITTYPEGITSRKPALTNQRKTYNEYVRLMSAIVRRTKIKWTSIVSAATALWVQSIGG
jgi:hypothetical protein